jgi:hypothetical protein
MDEFDRRVEASRKAFETRVDHKHTLDAAIYVRDTLELCVWAARTVMASGGGSAGSVTMDHAIALYDRVENERRRIAEKHEKRDQ